MTTASWVKAPSRRPALARTSSAASGFFFCGMIDEAGGESVGERDETKLGRHPDDDLLGQPREVDGRDAGGGQGLQGEIAVSHSVEEFAAGRSKPSALAVWSGQWGRASRRAPACPVGSRSSGARASADCEASRPNIFYIGHRVVAEEGHRLRAGCRWVKRKHQGRRVGSALATTPAPSGGREAGRACDRRPRAPTSGNPARPGRCASARVCAVRLSPNEFPETALPRSCGYLRIPRGTGRSPTAILLMVPPPRSALRMAAASSAARAPVFCNIAACAQDPSRSCAASRRETDGDVDRLHQFGRLVEKRPPHIAYPPLVAGAQIRGRGPSYERSVRGQAQGGGPLWASGAPLL